ncbi:MAG: hypothetical protein PWP41_145 [Moorella sp. (in: firmicutes)]|uniref:DUF2889 domain-containing protein n=1 Tax=Neomoorella thermoacetica TaxID=1525 RepID=A0A1J5P0Q4_NEOTH|nr:DUF2889 domain-containing protein [Moorella thermoacetica]MDN5325450.1 hypothetical protein [Moorella sp. (in: firmicutes)]OIQ10062.1 hypothetical protein MOOR_01320 [Moorella thermoacetica]OIQ57581.1 hypothetical protein MOTE_22610 [Moorella thermoacetica]
MDLFQRKIEARVVETGPDAIQVAIKLNDTFHEIALTLEARPSDRTITGARAEFIRFPYDRCRDTTARLDSLAGVTIAPGVWRTVAREVGGKDGCTHLYELTMEALRVAMQGFYRYEWERLPGEEQLPFLRRVLAGECYIYSHPEIKPRFLLEE